MVANHNVYLVDIRVYIAGVLVPILGAQINNGIEQGATAFIIMPPYPELLHVGRRDRVPVQIFYKDVYAGGGALRLMFDGYIINVSYVGTATQKTVNFECKSWYSVIGEFTFQEATGLTELLRAKQEGKELETSQSGLQLLPLTTRLLFKGLATGNERKSITMPVEYLQNIIGLTMTDDKSLNLSIYLAYYNRLGKLLRIGDRFCGVKYFDENNGTAIREQVSSVDKSTDSCLVFPILYGMQSKSAFDMLSKMSDNAVADSYTINTLVTTLSNNLDYEFLQIGTPAIHNSRVDVLLPVEDIDTGEDKVLESVDSEEIDEKTGIKTKTNKTVERKNKKKITTITVAKYDKNGKMIGEPEVTVSEEEAIQLKELATMCFKPILSDSPFAPQCNIVFRPQVLSVTMKEDFEGVPTRVRGKNTQGVYAQMFNSDLQNPLTHRALTDLYPFTHMYEDETTQTLVSEIDNMMLDGNKDGGLAFNDALLKSETYTGPVIADCVDPPWLDNVLATELSTQQYNTDDNRQAVRRIMIERFRRKQLMASIYGVRNITATLVFNPYIQPGFPGVIFDTGDTGMAFAGYVTTISHSFSAESAQSTITMTYVRELLEAGTVEIPHPVEAVFKFTHTKENITEICKSILGDGVSGENKWSGCECVHFMDLYKTYMPEEQMTALRSINPQNSLPAAYGMQNRNIVTLEQYLQFMGYNVSKIGVGPDGTQTVRVYDGEFLTDRMNTPDYSAIYEENLKCPLDSTVPNKELEHAAVANTLNKNIYLADDKIAKEDGTYMSKEQQLQVIACMDKVIGISEGGWTDDARDPGKQTMKGITLSEYRRRHPEFHTEAEAVAALKNISDAEVTQIKHEDYWVKAKCSYLPPKTAAMIYDCAFNQGVGRAAELLNKAFGLPPRTTFTKKTMAAMKNIKDDEALMRTIGVLREQHYKSLPTFYPKDIIINGKLKHHSGFGGGWLQRIKDVINATEKNSDIFKSEVKAEIKVSSSEPTIDTSAKTAQTQTGATTASVQEAGIVKSTENKDGSTSTATTDSKATTTTPTATSEAKDSQNVTAEGKEEKKEGEDKPADDPRFKKIVEGKTISIRDILMAIAELEFNRQVYS